MKTKFFTIALLLIQSLLFSQEITGAWVGELEVQGMKLPLIVNIKQVGGNYASTLDSPKQGAIDIPVNKTIFSNNELTLELPSMQIIYKGKFVADKFEGIFKQGEMELPLILERNNKATNYSFNRPQTPKAPFDYTTEEVSFVNLLDHNTLAGTITTPKDKKDFPIVILVTGSGAQNRDEELFGHKPFAVIADDFAKKGIATLRLDDRGVGGSSKTENATTANFASDINSAVAFLTQKGYQNIGLLGHSEGGMIAPMVASANKNVKFIISMAGPGVKIEELMAMQIERGGQLAGEKAEKVKLDLATAQKAFVYLSTYKGTNLATDMETFFTNELQQYPDGLIDKKTIEQQVKANTKFYSNAWFLYFIKFNPQDYISKLKIPVLAINGSKDFQVDAKTNLEGFEKGLKKAGNKKFETVNIEGLNHLFQECKTGAFIEYSEIEQTISPKVLDKMGAWILKNSPN